MDKLKKIGMNFVQGGALLLAGSGFFLYKTVFTVRDGILSQSWPSTQGTVVEARIEQYRTTGGTTSEKTIGYFFYEYSVDQETYSSNRLNFFSISGDPVTAAKQFQPGEKVTVYYDPDDPERAVIELGLPGIFVWLALAFGILLFVGFVSLTFLGDFGAIFARMTG